MTHSDFATAYEQGYTATVKFLVAAGVPGETAREMAQAGWARGWERRTQLREPAKLVSWINRISLNLFRAGLRGQPRTEELADFSLRPGTSAATIDVRQGLERCRGEDRELLKAYYVEGYTSRELGERERCSPGAIRVRVFRARRQFINRLKAHST